MYVSALGAVQMRSQCSGRDTTEALRGKASQPVHSAPHTPSATAEYDAKLNCTQKLGVDQFSPTELLS